MIFALLELHITQKRDKYTICVYLSQQLSAAHIRGYIYRKLIIATCFLQIRAAGSHTCSIYTRRACMYTGGPRHKVSKDCSLLTAPSIGPGPHGVPWVTPRGKAPPKMPRLRSPLCHWPATRVCHRHTPLPDPAPTALTALLLYATACPCPCPPLTPLSPAPSPSQACF